MENGNENIITEPGNAYRQLQELSNSNYEMRDGEPDIVGWDVKNSAGGKLGDVDELIFDPQVRKVRYLVLNMDDNDQDLETERRVLIPIGIAQLDAETDQVTLLNVTASQLSELPPYKGCPELTAALEMETRRVLQDYNTAEGGRAPYKHPQFYAHEHFDEDKFYNRGNVPDNNTIIPAEDMDQQGVEDRAEKVSRIMDRINRSDEEPKSTEFPEGRIVGEFQTETADINAAEPGNVTTESLERENNQPVEETGNFLDGQRASYVPEPESIEQEEAWQDETDDASGSSKLMEFFINELRDLLWAERELVETLPEMAGSATSAELKTAFESHLKETETHVNRLEQIFGILGLEPESRKCDAMSGILDEGDEIISATEEGTAQRDVGLIFAGQKAEHYEIASYGGMIALAKTLGYYEIAELLVLTLDEEKTADAKLTEIAEGQANYDASTERSED
jgi:ferritin-like metal-binding protein YciE